MSTEFFTTTGYPQIRSVPHALTWIISRRNYRPHVDATFLQTSLTTNARCVLADALGIFEFGTVFARAS